MTPNSPDMLSLLLRYGEQRFMLGMTRGEEQARQSMRAALGL